MRRRRCRQLAVADRAVGVADRRRGGAEVFATSRDRGTASSITPGTAVAAWRALGPICPGRASSSTTDPGPGRGGVSRGRNGRCGAGRPADQPGGRDATLRGPAARYRRGHGTGSTGSRFAVAGQGPLDPHSQRGRRLTFGTMVSSKTSSRVRIFGKGCRHSSSAAARACPSGSLTRSSPRSRRGAWSPRGGRTSRPRGTMSCSRWPKPISTSRRRGEDCSASGRRSSGPSCS